MYCLGCGRFNRGLATGTLCGECAFLLAALKRSQVYQLIESNRTYLCHTLFVYRDLVRRLILRGKVSGEGLCIKMLLGEVICDPFFKQLLVWADDITAVPSSLWGRVRGRLDIPGILVSLLKTELNYSNNPLRGSLFWRWRKRSLLDSKGDSKLIPLSVIQLKSPPVISRPDARRNILVIDDIVTTGFTMAQIAKQLPRNHVRFFAIADASRAKGAAFGAVNSD